MAKRIAELQERLQKELDEFKAKENESQKVITLRGSLEAQLTENSVVQSELDLLKEDAEVYKLIGPVLMKVELAEAKDNVVKRVMYIKNDLKRCEDQIKTLQLKQNEQRQHLTTLQKELQEAHKAAAS